MPRSSSAPARAALLVALGAAVVLSGCGGSGVSEAERQKKVQEQALDAIGRSGAKATLKKYPQGDAYAVDLSGAKIDDGVLAGVKQLGRISELDLSKSTVTDDHLERINDPGVASLLLKLDLSQTAVTDAGLDKLTNLLFLTDLNLKGTKVTAAAVERFKKARQSDSRIMPMFKSPKVRL